MTQLKTDLVFTVTDNPIVVPNTGITTSINDFTGVSFAIFGIVAFMTFLAIAFLFWKKKTKRNLRLFLPLLTVTAAASIFGLVGTALSNPFTSVELDDHLSIDLLPQLAVEIPEDRSVAKIKNTVSVNTDYPSYDVFFAAPSALYLDGIENEKFSIPVTENVNPAPLKEGTFGYNIDGSDNFVAVPFAGGERIVDTDIYFGVKGGDDLATGDYKGEIKYTVIANTTSDPEEDTAVMPEKTYKIDGGEDIIVTTNIVKFGDMNLGDAVVKIGDKDCAGTTMDVDDSSHRVKIYCTAPSQEEGSYDINISIPNIDWFVDLEDAITYETPLAMPLASTRTGRSATQAVTGKCSDNVGISSYYWGTISPTSASTFTAITSVREYKNENLEANSAETYYFACKNSSGVMTSVQEISFVKYQVGIYLQKTNPVSDLHTVENYELAGVVSGEYILPQDALIRVEDLFAAPAGIDSDYIGWSNDSVSVDDQSLNTSELVSTSTMSNKTYYGWYNREEFGIVLEVNNADYGTVSTNVIKGLYGATIGTSGNTLTIGGNVVTANPTTQAGYVNTFDGWDTSDCGGSTITKTCTIVANFSHSEDSYTISYNLDGGTAGTSAPTSVTIGEGGVDVYISRPTKSGNMIFAGWTITGMDGSTHYYGDGEDYADSTATSLDNIMSTHFKDLRLTGGTVTFKANWALDTGCYTFAIPITNIAAGITMQNFNSSVKDLMEKEQTYTITDSRDGKTYCISKLADGNVWMTENLRLGNTGSTTDLTPADSDISSDFTLSKHEGGSFGGRTNSSNIYVSDDMNNDNTKGAMGYYGYYYNFYAATAGKGGDAATGGVITESICPRGWGLSNNVGTGSYIDLLIKSHVINNASDTTYAPDGFQYLTSHPLYFHLSGDHRNDNDAVINRGVAAYYWTNTKKDISYIYDIKIQSSEFHNAYNDGGYGFPIRCVYNTYDISYDLNGGVAGTSMPTAAHLWNGSTDIKIDNPTRENYDFLGWTITGLDENMHYYGDSAGSYVSTTETILENIKATHFKNLRSSNGAVTFKANWVLKDCHYYATPLTTLQSDVTLQNLDTITVSNMVVDKTYSAKDTRDDKEYCLAKLQDDNVWMTENLRLGSATENTPLTPQDSDISTAWTLPARSLSYTWTNSKTVPEYYPGDDFSDSRENGAIGNYGYQYNYNAVTAGTVTSTPSSGTAPASICPKGWKLPDDDPSGQNIGKLVYTYGYIGGVVAGGSNFINDGYNKITEAPFWFVYAGNHGQSGNDAPVRGSGFPGWIGDIKNADQAYNFSFSKTNALTTYNPQVKGQGRSVRCVLRK